MIQSLQYTNNSITEQPRKFISALREEKKDITDSVKMEINFGLVGTLIYKYKDLKFYFLNKLNRQKKTISSANITDRSVPDDNIDSSIKAEQKKLKDICKKEIKIFKTSPAITIISYSLPRYDATSADYRLFHIINILLANKSEIEFIYCGKTNIDDRYKKAYTGNITFTHLALNNNSYIDIISKRNPEYIWITNLWRINFVKFITRLIPKLKEQNSCPKIIVDTMDFHFKEFSRRYKWTQNQDDLTLANEFLENEIHLYKSADVVVVVSEEEQKGIQDKISDINRFEIIPNIHEIHFSSRPYNKRRNICFIGNFGNKHNVDAVRYFIEKIFNYIIEKNPRVEFHIIGNGSEKYKKEFESSHVKVLGRFKDLQKVLTYYKLFVCPMTYGAGMKGKISGAAAAGLPVVTTSIGAEGFSVTDGEECYVSDSPVEFGEKCNQCLSDPEMWHNFSIKFKTLVAENFSPGIIAKKLSNILSH